MHEAVWLKKVADLRKACTELIGVPDPQIQHCLLRQCLDAAKVQFLLRSAPSDSPSILACVHQADEAIYGVLEAMVGTGLGPQARAQAALPFHQGGCGLRIPSIVRPAARIAGILSYERCGKVVVGVPLVAADVVPDDFPSILRSLQAHLGPEFDPLGIGLRSVQLPQNMRSRSGGPMSGPWYLGGS